MKTCNKLLSTKHWDVSSEEKVVSSNSGAEAQLDQYTAGYY